MSTVGMSLDIFCRDTLRELSADYEVIAISTPDSHLDNVARREGTRTIPVAMKREISPVSDFLALIRLTRILRRERPLIIHTMTPKAGLLGMMAAKLAKVPLRVHTFTGLLFPTAKGLRRRLLRLTDRLTCACATHIIPEGEGVKSDLIKAGITSKPLHVLGNGNVRGVDTVSFDLTPEIREKASGIRKRLAIPEGNKVGIFIGRFVTDKGLHELIEAFRNIDRQDFHLILAGESEGQNELPLLPEKTDRLHLSEGWVEDVRPWLAAADFHILPSYREGFPNTVLEAGAMGLPSIVTDVNGSREIISDGVNGFVVPPQSSDALRTAIEKMIDNPPLMREMGVKARANVVKKFRREYVSDCLKEYYHQIIGALKTSTKKLQ